MEVISIELFEKILNLLFYFIEFIIIVDVTFSWIFLGKENILTKTVKLFTDPLFFIGRKIQKKVLGQTPIDFAPLFTFLVISIIYNGLLILLFR
jgi:hypothetical protein